MATAKQQKMYGEFMAADGKLDAVKVTELFFGDVVFNNEDEITFDGKRHEMVGLQFNSDVLDRYPTVSAHYRAFGNAIREVARCLEDNRNLAIPKTMFHKRLLALTRKQPITGITFLDLCAWHLLRIKENSETDYAVSVDRHLVKGLPACTLLMAELVKTLRAYNGKQGAFTVTVTMTGDHDILEDAVAGSVFPLKSQTVSVAEGDSPFAGVLKAVRAAKPQTQKVKKTSVAPKPKASPAPKKAVAKKATPKKTTTAVDPKRVWALRGSAAYRAKWARK